MNDAEYWKDRWQKRKIREANPFAKKALSHLEDSDAKKVLDLGCGDGGDARLFSKEGYDVTAVDISESGIEKIKKTAPAIYSLRSDIKDVNFPPASFDAIYSHLSMYYFNEDEVRQIMQKVYSWLKPHGLVFISCKSTEDALYGKGEKFAKDTYKTNPNGHWRRFYTEDYMREVLKNFKILSIEKTTGVYDEYKSSFIEGVGQKKI